jgi:GDPmannose 4,6-dehydratase
LVREFVELAFGFVGLRWDRYVVVNEAFFRPAEVFELRGDASKARRVLGWEPDFSFKDLVSIMVQEGLRSVQNGSTARRPWLEVTVSRMSAQQFAVLIQPARMRPLAMI